MKRTFSRLTMAGMLLALMGYGVMCTRPATDQTTAPALGLWNDGPSKAAIADFVAQVTTPGSPDFIPEADRIAVFDNDGTLWCEHPLYFEMAYSLDAARQILSAHPELVKAKPGLKPLATGDMAAIMKDPERMIGEAFVLAHAGMSSAQFGVMADRWLDTMQHSRFKVPYTSLTYAPMIELLSYLRDNGFKTYIVSGGSNAFIRLFSESAYGIPVEQVIGTMLKGQFVATDAGGYEVTYLPELWHSDDKSGKPVAIDQIIGKKPVLAFGNSDGDLQMLQWTSTNKYKNLCLLLHHTDAEREYAYDSLSSIGTLKTALIEAQRKDWVVVDMKRDFAKVFAAVE